MPAIIHWINPVEASFQDPAAWTGGIVPGTTATAVINSAGDPLPVTFLDVLIPNDLNALDGNLNAGVGAYSEVSLANGTLATETTTLTSINGTPFQFYETPPASTISAGQTLTAGTIDLLGGSSEASLILQDSTLGGHTTVHVSGDAYLYAGYTNVLAGTIDVGGSFKIGSQTITSPGNDANGFANALYMNVERWGSWNNGGSLSGYVPSLTNTGTINVAAASALVVDVRGSAGGAIPAGVGGAATYVAPNVAAFINGGKINVAAGGTLAILSPFGSGTNFGTLINNGMIILNGAAGATTFGKITTEVKGAGTITLNGYRATNNKATTGIIDNSVAGNNFSIFNGSLMLDEQAPSGSGTNTFTGGTISFGGKAILGVSAHAYNTLGTNVQDTLAGMAKGDALYLQYTVQYFFASTWTPEVSWNQATHTLTITDKVTDGFGDTLTLQQGAFTLAGTYTGADFKIGSASWDRNESNQATATILCTGGS